MNKFKELLKKGLIGIAIVNLALFYSFVGLANSTQASGYDPVIIDNSDASFSITGSWGRGYDIGYKDDFYYTHQRRGTTQTATWSPELEYAGEYKVYIHWVAQNDFPRQNRATNVNYSVNLAETTYNFTVDQSLKADGSDSEGFENSGWKELSIPGNYIVFPDIDNFNVSISFIGTDGVAVADAVKFELIDAYPEVPTPQSPGITNNSSPLMNWSDVSDPFEDVDYNYQIRRDSPDSTVIWNHKNVRGTYIEDSQLQAGNTPDGVYYWQVMAIDDSGNQSEWSESKKLVIDSQAPDVSWLNPQDGDLINKTTLKASSDGGLTDSKYINFWWWEKNDSSNKSYHYVYRGDEGNSGDMYWWDFDPKLLGLDDGEYVLRAASKDGAGNYGSELIEVTIDTTAPDSLSIVKAEPYLNDFLMENRKEKLDLEGMANDANGIAKYNWYFDGSIIGSGETVISNSFFTQEPGDYTLKLEVIDNVGNSSFVTKALTVENELPATPALSMVREGDGIRLAWNRVDDTRGYQIIKNGIPIQAKNDLIPADVTEYLDKFVQDGTSYEYRVRAYDQDAGYTDIYTRSNPVKIYLSSPDVDQVAFAGGIGGEVISSDTFTTEEGEVKAQKDDNGKVEGEDNGQEDGVEESSEEAKTNWPMIIAIIIAATIVLGGAAYWWYGVSEDEDQI